MFYYLDTSFIGALLLLEDTTEQVHTFLQKLSKEQLAISHWTCVEFASLLARRVRMQLLTESQALETMKMFEEGIAESFYVIVPTEDDFKLATQLLQHHHTGLRGGDALHLAISQNHGASCLYTLDRGLISAASILNIPAKLGIEVH
jgi:hypothetical protein